MTMNTYEFTAFSEADLLSGGDTNLNCGDSFTMPGAATTCISVSDNDSFLSGDSHHDENADDSTGQTASIIDANSGNELGNGGQIYAESYFWVTDSAGNWYVLIEIEQEGVDNADFFTFYTGGGYSAPAAGTELTVHSKCNVNSNWIDYKCLDAGEKEENPGSISGRYFNDENCDGLEGAHEAGFDDKLIRLRDADTGEIVAETRTDANGNYSFGNVEPGRYCVIFEPMEGFSPTARDVGHDDTIDSDLKSNGESHIFTVEPGEHEDNIDAGVKAEPGTISGSVFCDIDCDGTNGTETVVAGIDYVIEAEDMHKYNYETVHGSQASGGQLARLKKAGGDGDLWTDFTGQSGVYDVTIRIQDENDGQSEVFFKVGGELVEVIKLDRDTDGAGNNNGGFTEFVIKDVPIDNGEQIKLWVGGDHGEFVRVDNIILEGQDTVVEAEEPAKEGVGVALLNADGSPVLDGAGDPITTVTDADGNYSFEGVAPGDYKIEFAAPDGTVFTEQDVGSDDTIDSDVDATGRSDTITLAPGGSVDVDAGLKDQPLCIEENTTFVTDLDLTVECPDGTIAEPNLIYSIEGGADAALFQVDPTTGELSFINAPDFENPLDAGGDNFYDVVVRATTNAPAIEEVHIDFQTLADGSALEAGDNGALVLDGVTFTAIRSHDHDNVLDDAMIFDAENPTGWDHDLGQAGQGNILIISEDGDSSDPDDEAHGGTFYATFDTPSTVKSIVVLDTEESGSIELFDVDGNVLATINIPAIANGTLQTIDLRDTANVASMAVHLCGSGALDDLKFLRENEPKFVEKQLEIEVKDVDEAGSISGRSFCDIDGNSLDNAGDTAIVQQLVVLLNPDGTAVLNSLGEAIITFTQSDGSYSFAEVPVGDYRVGFEVLGGKEFVAKGEDADNDGRSDDTTASDVDDAAAPISVSLGVVSIDVQTTDVFTINPGEDVADVDAGLFIPNVGPDATDDAFLTDEDGFIAGDLLGNDSDANGDTLEIIAANGVGVNTAFDVTSAGGRQGAVIVSASGALNFAFDTISNFNDLALGETDTVTVSYTITDGNGLTDTADVVVTVDGLNDGPVAVDDAFTIPEDGVVFGDLLGNDSDPDDDTLTILEANGVAVNTAFDVTSADGREGTAIVSADGALNFAFDTTQNFTDLNDGETDTITLSYTITDGNGLTDSADITVTVEGEGQPTALVSGNILNSGPGDRHLAVIVDASDNAVSIANAFSIGDLDGDGNEGTAMDQMLGKVSDLALTLESTDLITVIPSGFSGVPHDPIVVTFTAGDLQDAVATDLSTGNNAAQQSLFNAIVATYDPFDFTLDLDQSFDAAADVFASSVGFEQNKVIAMVASQLAFEDQGGDLVIFGSDVEGAFADLNGAPSNADIDLLIIAPDQFASAPDLSVIDSDGVVDVDTSEAFGLDTFLDPRPTVSSAADVVSLEITVDGVAQPDFDVSDLTPIADGFDFAFAEVLEGEIDVIIGLDTDADGNADLTRSLSDDLSAADRTLAQGDVFDFTLDGFLSDQLV